MDSSSATIIKGEKHTLQILKHTKEPTQFEQ